MTAGKTYTYSSWINIPSFITGSGKYTSLRIRWYDASGSVISPDNLKNYDEIKRYTGTTAGWVQLSGSKVAPSGISYAQVGVYNSSFNATVYVDDFSFATGTTSRPTLTPTRTPTPAVNFTTPFKLRPGQSCASQCASTSGYYCISVGNVRSQDLTMDANNFKKTSSDTSVSPYKCYNSVATSCSDVMKDKGTACYISPDEWTYCKCGTATATAQAFKQYTNTYCTARSQCQSGFCGLDQEKDTFITDKIPSGKEGTCMAKPAYTDCYNLNANAKPGQTGFFTPPTWETEHTTTTVTVRLTDGIPSRVQAL